MGVGRDGRSGARNPLCSIFQQPLARGAPSLLAAQQRGGKGRWAANKDMQE